MSFKGQRVQVMILDEIADFPDYCTSRQKATLGDVIFLARCRFPQGHEGFHMANSGHQWKVDILDIATDGQPT